MPNELICAHISSYSHQFLIKFQCKISIYLVSCLVEINLYNLHTFGCASSSSKEGGGYLVVCRSRTVNHPHDDLFVSGVSI